MTNDPIEDLVNAAIEAGPTIPAIQSCPNCRYNGWHGLPVGACPGSHVARVDPDLIHDAVLNWDADWMGSD